MLVFLNNEKTVNVNKKYIKKEKSKIDKNIMNVLNKLTDKKFDVAIKIRYIENKIQNILNILETNNSKQSIEEVRNILKKYVGFQLKYEVMYNYINTLKCKMERFVRLNNFSLYSIYADFNYDDFLFISKQIIQISESNIENDEFDYDDFLFIPKQIDQILESIIEKDEFDYLISERVQKLINDKLEIKNEDTKEKSKLNSEKSDAYHEIDKILYKILKKIDKDDKE